jgi:signal peptidase II
MTVHPIPTHRRLGFGLAALIIGLDQLAKWVVLNVFSLESVRQIRLLSIFNLTYVENRGISFGLFTAGSETARWALVALTLAVSGGVGWWLWQERTRGDVWALALILGGALGNIIDRIRLGYVIDYADLHFGGFQPFLVFNIADASITIGVLLLVARSLLLREKAVTGEAA